MPNIPEFHISSVSFLCHIWQKTEYFWVWDWWADKTSHLKTSSKAWENHNRHFLGTFCDILLTRLIEKMSLIFACWSMVCFLFCTTCNLFSTLLLNMVCIIIINVDLSCCPSTHTYTAKGSSSQWTRPDVLPCALHSSLCFPFVFLLF